MNFDRRLREREVAWNIFDLSCTCDFFCEHLKEAEQRAKVYIFSKNDSLCLIEVAQVGCVNFVVAETSCDTEVFARDFCLVKLVSRKNCAL